VYSLDGGVAAAILGKGALPAAVADNADAAPAKPPAPAPSADPAPTSAVRSSPPAAPAAGIGGAAP
jgi:hypothetical protein